MRPDELLEHVDLHPDIRQLDPAEWSMQAARLIQTRVSAILANKGQCSVMLTGGRSAERLYTDWASFSAFRQMSGVQFYFGDERCVPPDHPESNYGLAMRTLFSHGVPPGCSVFRMEADDPDPEAEALRYEEILPERVDVLLLGVGEDGHIASLFPGSDALKITDRMVIHVSGPKPPHERMTITPAVIAKAKSIFVLAAGPGKAQVFAKALEAPQDVEAMPARLALRATWMLDASEP